jgi:ABC-type phosphate transport system permease subunit
MFIVLLFALAGFTFCICYAIWLTEYGKYEVGVAFWTIGVCGVFAVLLVGLPLTF